METGLHYIRDQTFAEDQCRVRTGCLPRVMALFANLAISILRLNLVQNIQRTIRDILLQSAACTCMGFLV